MTPAAVLLLMALAPTAAAGAETAPTSPQPPRWERYQKVVQFNIFVRERGVREVRARRDNATKPAAPTMPAPHLILRGVSRRREAWVAIVEDIRSGQVLQVAPDDELAGGRVAAISMDGLTYSYGEATVDISVGNMIGSARQTADTGPPPNGAGTSFYV